MPKYAYECKACKGTFEIRHSIKERLEKCALCEVSHELERIPYMPVVLNKRPSNKKAGKLVKKYIEEAREELRDEKRERGEHK